MASEEKRLRDLLERLDRETATAFLSYVATMKSPAMIREVRRLLELNQVEEAINLVDSHIRRFASVIPRNYTRVGEAAVDAAQAPIRRLQPHIAISFDPAHPRAAAAMQRHSLDLINRIGGEQKTSIRNALTEAFNDGANPRQAARAYRDAIGLTEKQRQAVKRYRSLLENGNVSALDAGLADRRFAPQDKSLAARRDYLDNLSPEDIDRMTAAYEQRYVKYRSEAIARTESAKSLNAANHEATEQVIEAAGFEDDYVERTWRFTHDSRTRDSHRNLQVGVVTGQNTRFVTGLGNSALYPLDPSLPAEDVVQCRCVVTIRYKTRDEVEQARVAV